MEMVGEREEAALGSPSGVTDPSREGWGSSLASAMSVWLRKTRIGEVIAAKESTR